MHVYLTLRDYTFNQCVSIYKDFKRPNEQI